MIFTSPSRGEGKSCGARSPRLPRGEWGSPRGPFSLRLAPAGDVSADGSAIAFAAEEASAEAEAGLAEALSAKAGRVRVVLRAPSAGREAGVGCGPASEVAGTEAGVLRNPGEHIRPDFIVVVKCKDIVRPTGSFKNAVRTRRSFNFPAGSKQCREYFRGLYSASGSRVDEQ